VPTIQRADLPQKPRVLHLGKFYPPRKGGMESHLQVLCTELARYYDVKVVVADKCGTPNRLEGGVSVVRLRSVLTLAAAPFCPNIVGEIRRSKASLVHIHWPNPGAILAYLAGGLGARLIITYHSDVIRQQFLSVLFRPFLEMAFDRASAIIVSSPNYIRSSTVLRRYSDRCHVIPFGIPLERFGQSDAAAVRSVRQRYGNRLVLSVGRMVYYKGFEYLIEAMQAVDGHLLLVGDGPLRPELEQQAAVLGLDNRVSFLREIPDQDLPAYYHAAEVFALPSIVRSEAFGIVQIEAMAAGIPVVNTCLDSGVPFVSLDGVTGLTVPPADSAALATAINRLLDDEPLRKTLGERGRQRAAEMFSVEAMVSRTIGLYEQVMAHPPGSVVSAGAAATTPAHISHSAPATDQGFGE